MIAIVGGLLALLGYFQAVPSASIIGWYLLTLSFVFLVLGVVNYVSAGFGWHLSRYHYVLFIPLLIFSPGIYVIIKFLAIFKVKNTLLQSQSSYGSRGEAILEAAPQLGLQLYIALLSLEPSLTQILSIITSAAILSLPNIENYVAARGLDFGFRTIFKNSPVFLPASLFKVLSVSILCVFLRGWTALIIVATITLVFVCLLITVRCFYDDLNDNGDDDQQAWESVFLSWLTLAGLGSSEYASVCRLYSTLLVTIIYSLVLTLILIVCNVDPDSGYIHGPGPWIELELVKKPVYMNLILGSTVALGWSSLLLDIVSAWCKSHDWRSHNWGPLMMIVDWFVDPHDDDATFWERTVLLQTRYNNAGDCATIYCSCCF